MEAKKITLQLTQAVEERRRIVGEPPKNFSKFEYEEQKFALEIAEIVAECIRKSTETAEYLDWFRISKYDTQAKVEAQSLYLRRKFAVVFKKTQFVNVSLAGRIFTEEAMNAVEAYFQEVGGFKVLVAQEEHSPYWECWIQVLDSTGE